jgi:hypothetical protein
MLICEKHGDMNVMITGGCNRIYGMDMLDGADDNRRYYVTGLDVWNTVELPIFELSESKIPMSILPTIVSKELENDLCSLFFDYNDEYLPCSISCPKYQKCNQEFNILGDKNDKQT